MAQIGASFPGVVQVLSCSYTLSHGITPGTATLTIVPQETLPTLFGPLVFFDGISSMTFLDFRVDLSRFQYDQSGFINEITLLDKRWKWRYGEVTGSYNLREPSNPGHLINEKSPQQLADILFKAMNEVNYEIGDLPNETRPEVVWRCDNPAEALAALCESVGCRVVLQSSGLAAIRVVGQGAVLPSLPTVMSVGRSLDPPEKPDSIQICGGDDLYQIDTLLEAVGEDLDGQLKLIPDLSYFKPKAGFIGAEGLDYRLQNPKDFGNVEWAYGPKAAQLAINSIYHYYRIMNPPRNINGDNFLTVQGAPNGGRVDWIKAILPLYQSQLATEVDPDGVTVKKKPLIWGFFSTRTKHRYFEQNVPDEDVTSDSLLPYWGNEDSHYVGKFEINLKKGIVRFDEKVFLLLTKEQALLRSPGYDALTITDYIWDSAILGLRIGCYLREVDEKGEPTFRVPFHFALSQTLPEPLAGTGPLVITDLNLVREVYPQHELVATAAAAIAGIPNNIVDLISDNINELNADAQYQLDQKAKEYQLVGSGDNAYGGIYDINPDGAIQQVGWEVSPSGAFTRASINNEFSTVTVPYKERRFLERLNRKRDAIDKEKQEVQRLIHLQDLQNLLNDKGFFNRF